MWPVEDYVRARAMLERRWPDIADEIDACAALDTAWASWRADGGAKWGAWWRWYVYKAAVGYMQRESTCARAVERMVREPPPQGADGADRHVDAVRYWRLVPTLRPSSAEVVWWRAHGATLAEIGRNLGRSPERVRQIWFLTLNKLRREIPPGD